jgi:Fic family protein
MEKARFWDRFSDAQMNERQIKVLNRLLDGFEGNLTTSKWAKLCKCSQDTAYRDILSLVELDALKKADGAGRSTHYVLVTKVV